MSEVEFDTKIPRRETPWHQRWNLRQKSQGHQESFYPSFIFLKIYSHLILKSYFAKR